MSAILSFAILSWVDFHFGRIDFTLLLLQSCLGLVVDLFLLGSDAVKLLAHVLNLLCLRVVDVALSRDLLVSVLDFLLRFFKFLGHIASGFLCLGQLDLDVAQRALQLLIL